MALKLLQPSGLPLGQFDCLDGDLPTIKGGEVMTFGSVAVANNDLQAPDTDGYFNPGTSRLVAKKVTVPGTPCTLMLADDGTTGYGTLFGQVVGGTVGQQVTGGAVLGPHTATGSGKVTCWATPGLYGITLDALDAATLSPTVPVTPGTLLGPNASGLLTTSASGAYNAATKCATFVSFETDHSLVRTPNRLVAALNSPTGTTGPLANSYTMAVVFFNPQI